MYPILNWEGQNVVGHAERKRPAWPSAFVTLILTYLDGGVAKDDDDANANANLESYRDLIRSNETMEPNWIWFSSSSSFFFFLGNF